MHRAILYENLPYAKFSIVEGLICVEREAQGCERKFWDPHSAFVF